MLGPAHCTLHTTQGVSVHRPSPMFSIIREKPGPEVLVMDLAPPRLPPRMAAMEAISSSIWMNTPPTWGKRLLMRSATPVAGVMG